MGQEDEIKRLAYQLWEEEGRPEGRDLNHYYMAEILWQQRNAEIVPEKEPVRAKTKRRRATRGHQEVDRSIGNTSRTHAGQS